MSSFSIIVLIVAITISLLFKTTWIILGRLIVLSFQILKWLMIAGLLVSVCNLPQTYEAVGVTPISILFGDKIYTDIRDNKTHDTVKPKPKGRKHGKKSKSRKLQQAIKE